MYILIAYEEGKVIMKVMILPHKPYGFAGLSNIIPYNKVAFPSVREFSRVKGHIAGHVAGLV